MLNLWYDVLIERHKKAIKEAEKCMNAQINELENDKKRDKEKGTNFYGSNKRSIELWKSDICSHKEAINECAKEKYSPTTLSEEQQLACILHSIICRDDHYTNCTWFAQKREDGWDINKAKKKYLAKARKIIGIAPKEVIIKILSVI